MSMHCLRLAGRLRKARNPRSATGPRMKLCERESHDRRWRMELVEVSGVLLCR
ncbi:MAG: hypothetical protein JSS08_09145 [Proteobacteria bacterium]|nr:hypothetical protein [Pseudomonadota bacterium]